MSERGSVIDMFNFYLDRTVAQSISLTRSLNELLFPLPALGTFCNKGSDKPGSVNAKTYDIFPRVFPFS